MLSRNFARRTILIERNICRQFDLYKEYTETYTVSFRKPLGMFLCYFNGDYDVSLGKSIQHLSLSKEC